MTVRWTVRATEPTAVFSPQRKYKTVGSKSRLPPRSVLLLRKGVHRTPAPFSRNQIKEKVFHTEYLFFFVFVCKDLHLPTFRRDEPEWAHDTEFQAPSRPADDEEGG